MALTLRQRNRLAAMQHIERCAMDLFDDRGYQTVTVEDIASAAGVSTSTFYRYFGTKEGVFTIDTQLGMDELQMAQFLDVRELAETLRKLEGMVGPESYRGMSYVIHEPAVRSAVYAVADRVIDAKIRDLDLAGVARVRGRVYLRSLVFGVYFGSLEQWHLDGREGSPIEAMLEALSILQPIDLFDDDGTSSNNSG